MSINTSIFEGIRHNTDDYGIAPRDIENFLIVPQDFPIRQDNAINIIEAIMIEHRKQELLQYVVQLAKVEQGIGELEPKLRDHVVHALLSFLLGVFINEYLLKPCNHGVDGFQWKLAGLFHDVGYPAEIANKFMIYYSGKINKIKREISIVRPDVFFRVAPVNLDKLMNGVNSLDLIQVCLDRWELGINARAEYAGMVNSGNMCHGIISSLSVLFVVDMLYQKHNPNRAYVDICEPSNINWNQSYFEGDIVPACAAIFVHNLPARCFRSARINRTTAALPFLLRLSDCLQDWDRPSKNDPVGRPSDDFNIHTADGRLVFTVADPGRRNKIAAEIESSLLASDIAIIGSSH